jgi:hypothetical protein
MKAIKQASGPQRAESMLCERYDENKSFSTIQTPASEMDPELAQAIRALAIAQRDLSGNGRL